MSNKTLTLSIVIPVYNEQSYLKACLDSIAAQVVLPDEVIVVDNNSIDDTAQIAKSYKFVRLLHESHQHQSYAQARGFNAASSDIIGRIDGDSILPIDWVKNVKAHFAASPKLTGITGGTLPYDMTVKGGSSQVFKFYIGVASRLAGARMLWGANCALRRSDWLKVKDEVMKRGDIWEDYDISFCLKPYGRLEFVNDIDVDSSFRAVHRSLIHQTRYQFRAVRTFYHHTSKLKTAVFLAAWSTMFFVFLLVLLDRYILAPLSEAPEVVPLEAE